jgi:uncharacterized protein
VKLLIDSIKAVPTEAFFSEEVAEINALLAHRVHDYRIAAPIGVRVSYYRAGLDLFFQGTLWGDILGTCARCLEEYPFRVAHDFHLVLAAICEMGSDRQLRTDDLALSYYEGEEIDLSPLVREQMILALPTRPLCAEACRGLCSQCGVNLNVATCQCTRAHVDPRLAVLRSLKVDR